MKQFLGIWSYIVVIGYLLKILFQMYCKYKNKESLNIGAANVIGWEYWRPITLKEGSELNWLRRIFNLIHVVSILYLIVLFFNLLFSIKH